MSTNDVPAWAAWRWLDNLLDGDERGMDRADLLNELRTIRRAAGEGARVEREAYFRLMQAHTNLMTHLETGDLGALERSGNILRALHEEALERNERQTEDKIPRHWNVSEPRR